MPVGIMEWFGLEEALKPMAGGAETGWSLRCLPIQTSCVRFYAPVKCFMFIMEEQYLWCLLSEVIEIVLEIEARILDLIPVSIPCPWEGLLVSQV